MWTIYNSAKNEKRRICMRRSYKYLNLFQFVQGIWIETTSAPRRVRIEHTLGAGAATCGAATVKPRSET
jgi:hypothetical protein